MAVVLGWGGFKLSSSLIYGALLCIVLGGLTVGNQCSTKALVAFTLGLSVACSSASTDAPPAAATEPVAEATPVSKELGATLDGKAISLDNNTTQSALMEGIRARDVGQVQWALGKGASANARDANGFTPLVNALAHYNIDVIDTLIKNGAVLDLDSKLKDSAKSARVAVEQGDQMLFDAIHRGDLDGVKAAIEDGAKVNAVDSTGFTALVNAIVHGHKPIIKHLVENGGTIIPD